ncbi:MAG: hypothetical protein COC15_01900 [Legionellales bacterium]|nr:MAG: hypothetical protein COC15_01900 [Legionellales bacterium]
MDLLTQQLIPCLQNFYRQYNKIPPMRIFIKFYNTANKQPITSLDLYKLFPEQPMHQLCRQAGLPEPSSCI